MGRKTSRSKLGAKTGFQVGHKTNKTKPKLTRSRIPVHTGGNVATQLKTTRLRTKPVQQSATKFNVLASSITFNAILGLFPCLACHSIGKMYIAPTSLQGVVVSFVIKCSGHSAEGSSCSYQSQQFQSNSENINMQLAVGTKLLGLQKSQVQRLLWCLNTGIETENSEFSPHLYSDYWNTLFKRFEFQIVNEVCPKSTNEFRTQLMNLPPGEPVEVATDGTYPDKNSRHNSVACGSALMGKIGDEWRIVDLTVTKR